MMPSDEEKPSFDYIAFIDEAGDPGIKKVRPLDPDGASEWMTMGAILLRARDEPKSVEWVRDIRDILHLRSAPSLHFRNLSDARKLICAQYLASISRQQIAAFAVASHKVNMKNWRNHNMERYPEVHGWFYNWCVRLLLERITDAVHRHSMKAFGEPRRVKLVFSRRGGTKYNWLRVYLEVLINQSREGTTYLQKRVVKHEVLHQLLAEEIPNNASAGCQLADIVTSAIHCAADANGPRWNLRPAEALRPIIPAEDGFCFDYGVVLQPSEWIAAQQLSADQKRIFRFYQYNL